ncbi:MAG TPA: hypothetical protein VN541_04800 [Tepidisphaeraceae bacterium]|nr:hypothetical protein [Tepidisphaeraceae bacterium]
MLADYKSKANLAIGLAIILFIIAAATSVNAGHSGSSGLVLAAKLIEIVSGILFIWGCSLYAKAKGYSGYLGLLGFLSLIGLIILVFLPDKSS